MTKQKIACKHGATTIYVVVFTTLLLTAIVIGFVRLIVSEQENTILAQLSESAYDSALAGVEDAKIALIQYHNCKGKSDNTIAEGNTVNCGTINNLMKTANGNNDNINCMLIPKILGRRITNGEVIIEEKNSSIAAIETAQAYTCVKMDFSLPDYRSSLNATDNIRIVPLVAGNINSLSKVVVSWYSDSDGTTYKYSNTSGNKVVFPNTADSIATPPTISVQLIQADMVFNINDFSYSIGNTTDRGTVFLAPSNNYGSNDFNDFVKANNKAMSNTPKIVRCSNSNEFSCSATLTMPSPVQHEDSSVGKNGTRAFGFLVISIPYNQPATSFSVRMLDKNGKDLYFEGAQIRIDSTGRTNDVFSRVETRVEMSDIYFPYPTYALQLSESITSIEKNFYLAPNCRYVSSWNGSTNINTCSSTGVAQ